MFSIISQHLERAKEENPAKLSAARDELEEVGTKVEAARDALAADMFALVAKEAQLAHTLLQYVKLQRAYHESALHSLQDIVPELERFISKLSFFYQKNCFNISSEGSPISPVLHHSLPSRSRHRNSKPL